VGGREERQNTFELIDFRTDFELLADCVLIMNPITGLPLSGVKSFTQPEHCELVDCCLLNIQASFQSISISPERECTKLSLKLPLRFASISTKSSNYSTFSSSLHTFEQSHMCHLPSHDSRERAAMSAPKSISLI
jgi:hypothetical protein